MKVTGKVSVFVQVKEGTKGQFKTFRASISSKGTDGNWNSKYMSCRFNKELGADKLEAAVRYSINVIDGWINIDKYVTGDSQEHTEFVLFINDCEIEEEEPVKAKTTKKTKKPLK